MVSMSQSSKEQIKDVVASMVWKDVLVVVDQDGTIWKYVPEYDGDMRWVYVGEATYYQ